MGDNQEERMAKAKVFLDKCNASTTDDELLDVYDEYCTKYDELVDKLYNGGKLVAECSSKVITDKKARVLDCGAGTGQAGIELHHLGYDNIDALDMSEGMLNVADGKGVYTNLICSKLTANPTEGIETDAYNAVISSGTFVKGHLDDKVFTELVRIIKPGGYICILTNEALTHIVEGDTFNSLVECKSLEMTEKCHVKELLTGGYGGYFYALKVLC